MLASTQYKTRFHVPSAWVNNALFQQLMIHRYDSSTHTETMKLVNSALSQLGYQCASVKMKHDYLCHMLEDLLQHKGIAFLTEMDLRGNDTICSFIGADDKPVTPDLFISGKNGFVLLDIYCDIKSLEEVKAKYKMNEHLYFTHVIHTGSFVRDLLTSAQIQQAGLFEQNELEYIEDNFNMFITEWQYWGSCLAMNKILLDEVHNVPQFTFTIYPNFSNTKQMFKQTILDYFEKIRAKPAPCRYI